MKKTARVKVESKKLILSKETVMKTSSGIRAGIPKPKPPVTIPTCLSMRQYTC